MNLRLKGVGFWFWFAVLLSAGLFVFINISWMLDEDRKHAISYIKDSGAVMTKLGEVEKVRLWKSLDYYGTDSDPGYKKMFFSVKGGKGEAQVIILFKEDGDNRRVDIEILD